MAVPAVWMSAVIHWRHSHFVVVERITRGRIAVVDPGIGRYGLPPEEFARDYSGVTLIFGPGPTSSAAAWASAAAGGRATCGPSSPGTVWPWPCWFRLPH
ncbi:cysteine peptidase family C39 domain-containing protein [Streptosporangium canum]|uniref:cysteine peptidase family C39 domain-containing protein n=1 Tax=Streptosporangium canum TaxID=324952 RepID=UPI00344305AA